MLKKDQEEIQPIPYPRGVYFILLREFCEKFALFGTQTIVPMYLRNHLGYTEGASTKVIHGYIGFEFVMTLFGGMLADCYLGKYKTVYYVSFVSLIGYILVTSSAMTPLGAVILTLVGLALVSMSAGLLRPCSVAFGGDQFVVPDQATYLKNYFSIYYFIVNVGGAASSIVTPILRKHVSCFGQHTCYAIAFGVPVIVMAIAILIFRIGASLYVMKRPEGNRMFPIFRCISCALVRKCSSKYTKRKHWMDNADDSYDVSTIEDIKTIINIITLYIPLPLFWTLFEQQFSTWIYQASRLNGEIGSITILPDHMQVLNHVFIMLLIPVFEGWIYPSLTKCNLLTRSLQRMTVGLFLAVVAFLMAGVLELFIERTYPVLPGKGEGEVRIINGLPCKVTLNGTVMSSFQYWLNPNAPVSESIVVTVTIPDGCPLVSNNTSSITVELKPSEGILKSYLITMNRNKLVVSGEDFAPSHLEKSQENHPRVQVIYSRVTDGREAETKLKIQGENAEYTESFLLVGDVGITVEKEFLYTGKYIIVDPELSSGQKHEAIVLETAGVYTLVVFIGDGGTTYKLITTTEPNSVHILWQVPQYMVITMAEVMFVVTGLEFTFEESPETMKTVLQAAWLLSIAFGNIILVFVTAFNVIDRQALSYFLYSAIMVLGMLIFMSLAVRYKYKSKINEFLPTNTSKPDSAQELELSGTLRGEEVIETASEHKYNALWMKSSDYASES